MRWAALSIIGLAVMALASCYDEGRVEQAPQAGEFKFGIEGAPPEFQGPVAVGVIYGTPDEVHAFCANFAQQPVTYRILACSFPSKNIKVMPNPCPYQDWDPYARLDCHENGHFNGWEHVVAPG